MKIVMVRKYGYSEKEQDTVTVVGVYDDTIDNEKILDEVFLKHGYLSEKKSSLYSNRTISKDNLKLFYHINGAIEIHNNISISGLLENSLDVY